MGSPALILASLALELDHQEAARSPTAMSTGSYFSRFPVALSSRIISKVKALIPALVAYEDTVVAVVKGTGPSLVHIGTAFGALALGAPPLPPPPRPIAGPGEAAARRIPHCSRPASTRKHALLCGGTVARHNAPKNSKCTVQLCTLSSRPVLHLEPLLSGCRGAPLLLLLPLPPPRPPPLQRPQGPFGNERFDGAFLKCMCVCAYVRKKRTISINDLAEVTADNMIIHMDSATAELSPSSPPSESESPAAAGRHRSHTCDFLTYSVFPKRASSSPSSRRCNSVRSRSSAPAGAPAAAPRVRPPCGQGLLFRVGLASLQSWKHTLSGAVAAGDHCRLPVHRFRVLRFWALVFHPVPPGLSTHHHRERRRKFIASGERSTTSRSQ